MAAAAIINENLGRFDNRTDSQKVNFLKNLLCFLLFLEAHSLKVMQSFFPIFW